MPKRDFWVGVLLSVVVVLWSVSGAVLAKGRPEDHADHGKGHSALAPGHDGTTSNGSSQSSNLNAGTGSAPPGNNGTVKVDNYADGNGNDVAPNNEPHVTCRFGIDAYGYEAAAPTGTETFLQHPPTRGGSAQLATLTNANPRGTGRTYNGSTDNSLALVGTPHPKQGYHVKLTYTAADGNVQGAIVKHKVFWVQPCTLAAPAAVGPFVGHAQGATAGNVSPAFQHAVFGALLAGRAHAVTTQPGFTG